MDFGTVALVQAVVGAIVGAAFLVVPRQWVAPFGMRMDDTAAFLGRMLGAALLGLAVLCWLGRESTDPAAQRAIAYANLVPNAIGAILYALAIARREVVNARGWGLVVLLGAMAVAWALIALTRSPGVG